MSRQTARWLVVWSIWTVCWSIWTVNDASNGLMARPHHRRNLALAQSLLVQLRDGFFPRGHSKPQLFRIDMAAVHQAIHMLALSTICLASRARVFGTGARPLSESRTGTLPM